ncbi:unnamed protein product [Arctia plantaginis]|uniref:Tetraspanin n=1 Tax=Arctia plantaginis TaxID=874455 RepID=A0A8S1B6P5_ARCPL|nr:unnamed protein product [Arctia plantaginis]
MIGCGAGAEAMRFRFVKPLLAHVNLLLVLYGGAALATAARLKWDPSTYIVFRELFPSEYRALTVGVTAAGFLMLLMPHLAIAGLHATLNTTRKILLYIYAGVMLVLLFGELSLGVWLALRVQLWLNSQAAQQLQEAMELREHLKPLLRYFSRWHPLPQHIDKLIKEAEQDAPCNLYLAAATLILLAVLQPLAIGLALCAARRRANAVAYSTAIAKSTYSAPEDNHCEKAPLRTAYRNGRIVIL